MPTMQEDLKAWGPSIVVVLSAAAICATLVLTRPSGGGDTAWIDNEALAATAKATSETATEMKEVRLALDQVRDDGRETRCNLQRVTDPLRGGSGISFDPACSSAITP